jgi:hypothetical protein
MLEDFPTGPTDEIDILVVEVLEMNSKAGLPRRFEEILEDRRMLLIALADPSARHRMVGFLRCLVPSGGRVAPLVIRARENLS